MSRNLKIALIIIYSLIILAVLIYILTRPPRVMNKFDFPRTIYLVNGTDFTLDTVAMVLMNKVLGYDTLEVHVFYLPPYMKRDQDMTLNALVQPVRYYPNKFVIFINPDCGKSNIKKILCHEFIHIRQMKQGDLVMNYDNPKLVTHKGKSIDLTKVEYRSRSYEREALVKQWAVLRELRFLLYKK